MEAEPMRECDPQKGGDCPFSLLDILTTPGHCAEKENCEWPQVNVSSGPVLSSATLAGRLTIPKSTLPWTDLTANWGQQRSRTGRPEVQICG